MEIIERCNGEFEKIGLYVTNVAAGAIPTDPNADTSDPDSELAQRFAADPLELLRDDSAEFFLVFTMRTGDVAFSDRVLNPEEYASLKEFKTIAPSEAEILRERAKDELKEWNEGWDI